MVFPAEELYKVLTVGTIVQQLQNVASRAAEHGMKEAFLTTLQGVEQQLARNPNSWGDRAWNYKSAGLEEYHRLYEMISVRYVIDQANRVVYLKEYKPVLSHPLAEP